MMQAPPLDGFPFQITQQVIWGQMDAFQHVNNTVYFRYFEDVRIHYIEQVGMLADLETSGLGPILASTTCNFRAPLTYPDTIHIATRINNLRARRFDMEYLIYSETMGKIAADGTGRIVYYDYAKAGSCDIPKHIVAAMQELQPDLRQISADRATQG